MIVRYLSSVIILRDMAFVHHLPNWGVSVTFYASSGYLIAAQLRLGDYSPDPYAIWIPDILV